MERRACGFLSFVAVYQFNRSYGARNVDKERFD